MMRSKPWFAAKRYGYGSGLPIAWQGWAVLAIYFLVVFGTVAGLPMVLHNEDALAAAILLIALPATVVLLIICAKKTDGGWHWRWGK